MALTTGTRLGGYDITAQIGEGGMGQVYRATDTRLKRHVAIKILPSSLAADAEPRYRTRRPGSDYGILVRRTGPEIKELDEPRWICRSAPAQPAFAACTDSPPGE